MLKIVIADIEPIQRKSIKMIIERNINRKVIIFEVDSGEQLLQFVRQNRIDLVLMDTRLVGMSGVACIKYMKEHLPFQKLIVFTPVDDVASQETLTDVGITNIILKPVRPKQIYEIIKHELRKTSDRKKSRTDMKIDSIIQFIDDHIYEDITLSFMAEKTNFSTYYLSKVFKKEIGKNFVTYVSERKVKKAKELLKNSEIPIVDIALQLGFTEPSYFTKVFKKIEKITPSQYRSQYSIW